MGEVRWLTEAEGDAWRGFLRASRFIEAAVERQLSSTAGMPHTYYGVLVVLAGSPGGRCRLSDLAAVVAFSQSRLTHAVARMESAGWLRRESRPGSRREKDAVLTPSGRETLDAAAPGHVALVREVVFDHLSAEQVGQLQAICASILGAT